MGGSFCKRYLSVFKKNGCAKTNGFIRCREKYFILFGRKIVLLLVLRPLPAISGYRHRALFLRQDISGYTVTHRSDFSYRAY